MKADINTRWHKHSNNEMLSRFIITAPAQNKTQRSPPPLPGKKWKNAEDESTRSRASEEQTDEEKRPPEPFEVRLAVLPSLFFPPPAFIHPFTRASPPLVSLNTSSRLSWNNYTSLLFPVYISFYKMCSDILNGLGQPVLFLNVLCTFSDPTSDASWLSPVCCANCAPCEFAQHVCFPLLQAFEENYTPLLKFITSYRLTDARHCPDLLFENLMQNLKNNKLRTWSS